MFLRHALQVMTVITVLAGSRDAAGADLKPPTFTKDVAPIINKHCLAKSRHSLLWALYLDDETKISKWQRHCALVHHPGWLLWRLD